MNFVFQKLGLTFLLASNFLLGGTQYLSSDTIMNYGPGRIVVMGAEQVVSTDDSTGYVASGRLSASYDSFVDYGPSRNVLLLKNSLVQFSNGFVSDGYLSTSTYHSLNFGSSNWAFFLPNSHIQFSGGYVSSGYLYGNNQSLPYGNGSVVVNVAARVDFSPGPTGVGVLKKCVLADETYINYGPNRSTLIRGNGTFTEFNQGYLSRGVLHYGAYLKTATSTVYVNASSIVNFAGGWYIP